MFGGVLVNVWGVCTPQKICPWFAFTLVVKLFIAQGVSYNKKFCIKRSFPNYFEVAISQFGSGKNSYKNLIGNQFFASYSRL